MSGDKTYLDLGWTGAHITFGSGYDVVKRSLRSSAFEHFDVNPDKGVGIRITPKIYTIETLEELTQEIKSEVKVSVPLEGARIEASSSFLNSVKLSNKSMLQVVQQVIEEPPKRADVQKLKLTSQAAALLGETDGSRKFRERYGDFFVYGCRSKSTFAGVLKYKANSREDLNQFKQSLSVDAGDLGGAAAGIEATRKKFTGTITSDLSIDINGYDGPRESISNDKSLDDAYQKFQTNYKTVPYLALLCHYSVIDSRIPPSSNPLEGKGPILENAFHSLYIMQSEILSSPMTQATKLSKRIATISDDLVSLNVVNEDSVKRVLQEVSDCLQAVNHWETRASLLEDAQKLSVPALKYNEWIEAGTKHEWARGIMGLKGHPKWDSIANDVEEEPTRFQAGVGFSQYAQEKYTVGHTDRIIVGFKITGHRTDEYNGSFILYRGNIFDSEIEIEFSSASWREADWSITIWSVDKLLYEKVSS